MVNKLRALKNITRLNTNIKKDTEVRGHFAHLESQCSHLASLGSTFEESLKGAILLSLVTSHREFVPIICSIITIEEETARG